MIAPAFVMIESILNLRQYYESILFSRSSISLAFADGLAIRCWKFVFCYVFHEGLMNSWIVFNKLLLPNQNFKILRFL